MKNLFKNLYEHLKTRKKYNTLMLKYEVAREDLEKKQIELNTERRIYLKRQQIWEDKLKEQEQEIIELKKRKKRKENEKKVQTKKES